MEVTTVIGLLGTAVSVLFGSMARMYWGQIKDMKTYLKTVQDHMKERLDEKNEELLKKEKELSKYQARERETIDGLKHLLKENNDVAASTLKVLNALHYDTRKP